MPRRNRNACAPALNTDELASQADQLAAELSFTTEAVTPDDHD